MISYYLNRDQVSTEPWKRILFVIVAILNLAILLYDLVIALWLLSATQKGFWTIIGVSYLILTICFVVTNIFAIISGIAGQCGEKIRPCVIMTFSVWIYLLGIICGILLVCSMFRWENIDASEKCFMGAVLTLINIVILLPTYCLLKNCMTTNERKETMQEYIQVPYFVKTFN